MNNPWAKISLVNPQREDGNRQINNEVFAALVRADLTGAEYKICLAVIGKTWGFNKPSDFISRSQFRQLTGLSEEAIRKAIRDLKKRRIIHYRLSKNKKGGYGNTPLNEFLFNKHYDTWIGGGGTVVPGGYKTPFWGGVLQYPHKRNIYKRKRHIYVPGRIRGPFSVLNSVPKDEEKEPTTEVQTPPPPPPKTPICPHKEIIALYHSVLPELTKVIIWNDFRKELLQTRWREDAERQNLEWWKKFFERIRESDFLMGRVKDFRADLEWMIRPRNFPKVIEGKYHHPSGPTEPQAQRRLIRVIA